MKSRDDYLAMRRVYEPKRVKLVIVAESPPDSGQYFYDPMGKATEWLFAAIVRQLGFTAMPKENKERGLSELRRKGWLLVDATYRQVNNLRESTTRNRVLENDYPLLRRDLERLLRSDRSTPLILIKKTVCRVLRQRLLDDGFRVLNGVGDLIPFPSHSHQGEFARKFGALIDSAGETRPLTRPGFAKSPKAR
jgi:hypothetical protein